MFPNESSLDSVTPSGIFRWLWYLLLFVLLQNAINPLNQYQSNFSYWNIYIYAFSRCFYPKRLRVHSGYTYFCWSQSTKSMRKTRMPGIFKAPQLPLLLTMRGMVRCDWLSWYIAFCRERRLAFVTVWEKNEKTWQNNMADFVFCIKCNIYFSIKTRYKNDFGGNSFLVWRFGNKLLRHNLFWVKPYR